jgi:hypothetical protein
MPSGAQETSLHYLQGGLIDLRYGQASVDTGGTGVLLQWTEKTRFTLNGSRCVAEDLALTLKDGTPLTVATGYTPADGLMLTCDALSSVGVPAVDLQLEPWQPIMTAGDRLQVSVSKSEARRLNLVSPKLFIPGVDSEPTFSRLPGGALRTTVAMKEGWNWRDIPLFLRSQDGRVFRGKTVSVSCAPPEIGEVGPAVASSHLDTIPGFFELKGNTSFLDFTSVRVTASTGVEIIQIYPRPDRVDFTMKTIGPGTYVLRAEVSDRLGRQATRSWSFSVR